VNNVRTVSDTKRAFYAAHTRPINSIYRRVVEELMVEMHLLSVNVEFRYDPIYSLGVVTTFDRFMQGYQPERDKESIFNALCRSVEGDPQVFRQDADRLQSAATQTTLSDLTAQLQQPSDENTLVSILQAIATQDKFKYSRLFAIGLYTLLEQMDAELVKDEKRRNDALEQLSQLLHLPSDKMQKDLELFRSNLEKITQAQIVMQDILKADRKKKEDRAKAKDAVVTPPSESA
jgi:photosystem II biogenesis protein Psp29